ncbi:MAG: MarR family transcriptional regulator [bacterium]|nr:MarR family transcriptional regulator [bacterium]
MTDDRGDVLAAAKAIFGESDGHELAMSLRRAYLALHRATNAALHPSGLSADSFTLLTILSELGAMTQKELGDKASSDANTVSAMLSRLESRGLIAREPHPSDGRARIVKLTEAGRHTQRELWELSQPIRDELERRFDSTERMQLTNVFKRIADSLGDARG